MLYVEHTPKSQHWKGRGRRFTIQGQSKLLNRVQGQFGLHAKMLSQKNKKKVSVFPFLPPLLPKHTLTVLILELKLKYTTVNICIFNTLSHTYIISFKKYIFPVIKYIWGSLLFVFTYLSEAYFLTFTLRYSWLIWCFIFFNPCVWKVWVG